jgi:osmotically-inducible protein OsmY
MDMSLIVPCTAMFLIRTPTASENAVSEGQDEPSQETVVRMALKGYASRPALKDSARQVANSVEGVATVDMGLTRNLLIGCHPIVQNGSISLYGTILNQADKAIAGMMATQVIGSLAVENNLAVEMAGQQEEAGTTPRIGER